MLRIPTRDRPSVFEFESEADRDQAIDIITPLVKSAQEKGKAVANGNLSSHNAAAGPHAELKKTVLAADRSVRHLISMFEAAEQISRPFDEFADSAGISRPFINSWWWAGLSQKQSSGGIDSTCLGSVRRMACRTDRSQASATP